MSTRSSGIAELARVVSHKPHNYGLHFGRWHYGCRLGSVNVTQLISKALHCVK